MWFTELVIAQVCVQLQCSVCHVKCLLVNLLSCPEAPGISVISTLAGEVAFLVNI